MKKVFAFVLTAAVLASPVFADSIIMRNGQTVENAKIVKVNADDIEYRVGERETLYSARKAEVERVTYSDGTQDVFNAPPPPKPVREKSGAASDGWYGGIEGRVAFSSFDFVNNIADDIVSLFGSSNIGYGLLAGCGIKVVMMEYLIFKPELSFSYRVPSLVSYGTWSPNEDSTKAVIRTTTTIGYAEYAICFQALFQGRLNEKSRIFLEGGAKLNFPFNTKYGGTYKVGMTESNKNYDIAPLRSTIDFGAVYGFGFHISDKIEFSFKNTSFLNDFFKIYSSPFSQLDISVTVLLSGISL